MTITERAIASIGHNKMPANFCPCCGHKKPSPRNAERHKLFFAILPKAFSNWPTGYENFQPMSTEHLRKWLIYKAGWCTMRELAIDGPNKRIVVTALKFFLESGNQETFYTTTAKSIREYRPKSIAWNKCKEAEFKKVLDRSAEIIESIIGMPIEALKKEGDVILDVPGAWEVGCATASA
jgi:hypothetical protein